MSERSAMASTQIGWSGPNAYIETSMLAYDDMEAMPSYYVPLEPQEALRMAYDLTKSAARAVLWSAEHRLRHLAERISAA